MLAGESGGGGMNLSLAGAGDGGGMYGTWWLKGSVE